MHIRRLRTRALRPGFIAALFVGLTFPAFALDPRSKITDLAHTAFTGADVPFSQVFGLVQTQDGYLWLTTTEGIFPYDGVRFTRFEPLSRMRLKTARRARWEPLGRLQLRPRQPPVSGADHHFHAQRTSANQCASRGPGWLNYGRNRPRWSGPVSRRPVAGGRQGLASFRQGFFPGMVRPRRRDVAADVLRPDVAPATETNVPGYGGIYRSVTLVVTDPVYLEASGPAIQRIEQSGRAVTEYCGPRVWHWGPWCRVGPTHPRQPGARFRFQRTDAYPEPPRRIGSVPARLTFLALAEPSMLISYESGYHR